MIVSRRVASKDSNHENTSMHSCHKNIGQELFKTLSVTKVILCWVEEEDSKATPKKFFDIIKKCTCWKYHW